VVQRVERNSISNSMPLLDVRWRHRSRWNPEQGQRKQTQDTEGNRDKKQLRADAVLRLLPRRCWP
jgi:hypothetical protein